MPGYLDESLEQAKKHKRKQLDTSGKADVYARWTAQLLAMKNNCDV
jgi:hypothetical protein